MIKKKERKLLFTVTLKDCEVQYFRSGGPGGQHQNKVETGVRIIHHPSGGIGESRSERSQYQNKKNAIKRLSRDPKFVIWARIEAARLEGQPSIDDIVDTMMKSENIIIEGVDDSGRWKKL